MAIHPHATSQNKCYHQKNLAKPKKAGGRHPIMSEILVFIVDYFVFHNMLFACAKISKVAQKKLFVCNNLGKAIFLFYKMLPNYRTGILALQLSLSRNWEN